MIMVDISRDADGAVREIGISGHADFDEYGKDIICAAVSALAINFANSVDAFSDDAFCGEAEESGNFRFVFPEEISPASQLLTRSLILGLESIRDQYGEEYINFRFREV